LDFDRVLFLHVIVTVVDFCTTKLYLLLLNVSSKEQDGSANFLKKSITQN